MLKNIVETIDRWLGYGALAALLASMVLTVLDAGGRYLFNSPIQGTQQITEDYLLVMIVYLILGHSYRKGAHVRVTLLVERVSVRARVAMAYFAHAFSILCGVALTIATFTQTHDLWERGTKASGMLDYLLWPPNMIVFLGCLMMTLLMILDTPGVGEEAARATGVPDASSEAV